MLEIVLDTETTGISVKEGHRIVEIGCIELDNLIPTKNKFHCYLNPERKVSEKAFKVHGYSDEFLSKQKKFSEISEQFLNFIQLIVRTILYFNPLKVFMPIGLILISSSFGLLMYRIFVDLAFGVTIIVMFLAGIQLLALGIIADLIVRRSK